MKFYFISSFLNAATRKCEITYVSHIVFLSASSVLGWLSNDLQDRAVAVLSGAGQPLLSASPGGEGPAERAEQM